MGTMTHNILLTRLQGKKQFYLPGMGSLRTRTVDAMGRQRREGWLQHCPLSYDQARCSHPPFAECYAIQAFSIASDFDPQLMPKIQNQITMRKVCIVIQSPCFASSKSPFGLQLGSRETPHASHRDTEEERCLRRNQRRAARAVWVRCEPSTPRRDPKTGGLARSSRRRAQPFLPSHCCSEGNQACLPGPLWSSSREGKLFKKLDPGAQFQWERISSAVQPRRSLRGSEAEPTTNSRYSSFRGHERSLDPRRLRRAIRHSRTNSASPKGLRRPSAFGSDLRRGKVRLAFHWVPPSRHGPDMQVFQQASGSPDQAYPDPRCVYVGYRPCLRDHRPCTSPDKSGEGSLQRQPMCLRQREYSQSVKDQGGRRTRRTPPPCPLRKTSLKARFPPEHSP